MNVLDWPSAGRLAGAAALCIWSATATAAPIACSVGPGASAANVGGATTDDVTLKPNAIVIDSTACVISNVNAQSGPNGDTSGFSGAFSNPTFGTNSWSLLTQIDVSGNVSPTSATFNGITFTSFGFTQDAGNKSGTWSITTNQAAKFDLVFAMHAGGYTDAFLFDGMTTLANVTATGTWKIEWLNDGGQVPSYSNLTLFVRDVEAGSPSQGTPVPEPETLLLTLTALAALPIISRRRKQA